MKCSESWLREWVNPKLSLAELCEKLTMAGLEVESITSAADFTEVIIGKIVKVSQHPKSHHLKICEVEGLKANTLQIVCGAPNVRVGMKAPLAIVGAKLSQHLIKESIIRGVTSYGMLCSAKELGLSDDHEGLLVLPDDAPVGTDFKTYLQLNGDIIDVSITPNRGDCLSVKGLARDVSAITATPLSPVLIPQIPSTIQTKFPVTVEDKQSCPSYVGRVIKNINILAKTPVWLMRRLEQAGIRSINAVVDVTNYVMLELGQPMHAFDLNRVEKEIIVRKSRQGEVIELLDGSKQTLDDATLVIADSKKSLAIAGVMGGMDSGVTSLTTDIFLESAFFLPTVVARQRQHYHLDSDSAYRFERGVDPLLQTEALNRATALVLELTGGEPGEIISVIEQALLPSKISLKVTAKKIKSVLGMTISDQDIVTIFSNLGFPCQSLAEGLWQVDVPSYRFDIKQPEDLIEEIARLYGYQNIPSSPISAILTSKADPLPLQVWRDLLTHRGYHEIVSYSFVDRSSQQLLDPKQLPREIVNPITAEMTVMRTNLWPGLIEALVYNHHRQQSSIRLFEIGRVFITVDNKLVQELRLGGVMMGSAFDLQWGIPERKVDFYDLKGHLEDLLQSVLGEVSLNFKPSENRVLHPGQSANIYLNQQKIGYFGLLHPKVLQQLDLPHKVFIFEIDLGLIKNKPSQSLKEVSKFPEIRRDLALLVNEAIPGKDIQDTIKGIAGDWLKDIFIFDVYKGKGISPGLKSIALALILQHPARTLVDEEVAELMGRVTKALQGQLGAELRS